MFKNKRVVITGGSEGIGFACAEYFLKREAAVLITAVLLSFLPAFGFFLPCSSNLSDFYTGLILNRFYPVGYSFFARNFYLAKKVFSPKSYTF